MEFTQFTLTKLAAMDVNTTVNIVKTNISVGSNISISIRKEFPKVTVNCRDCYLNNLVTGCKIRFKYSVHSIDYILPCFDLDERAVYIFKLVDSSTGNLI